LLAVRVTLTGAAPLHARLLADAELRNKAEAAVQRCGDEVWLERLRVATSAQRRSGGRSAPGLDLAASLEESAGEPARRAGIEVLVATVRARLPGGLTDEADAALNLESILAEAQALTLGRAEAA
jgi:hypothetical protein